MPSGSRAPHAWQERRCANTAVIPMAALQHSAGHMFQAILAHRAAIPAPSPRRIKIGDKPREGGA